MALTLTRPTPALTSTQPPASGTPRDWSVGVGATALLAAAVMHAAAIAAHSEHRPAGKLALKLKGAGPILQRFGIPANVLNVGSLLGVLLGKGKKPDAEPAPAGGADAGPIRLTLTLEGGKAMAGPLPLPVELRPLY